MSAPRPLAPLLRLVNAVEAAPTPLALHLGLFFVVPVARVTLENSLFPLRLTTSVYAHETSFFLAAFFGVAFILHALTRRPLGRVLRLVSVGLSITLFPPLLDRFVFGRAHPYQEGPAVDWLRNLLTLTYGADYSGTALASELLIVILLCGLYVLVVTGSGWRALAALLLADVFIVSLCTPDLYLPRLCPFESAQCRFFGDQNRRVYLTLAYLLHVGLFASLLGLGDGGRRLLAVVRNCRPLRTLMFAAVAVAGMALSGRVAPWGYPDALYVALALIAVVCAWQYAIWINDLFDVPIDRIAHPQRPLAEGQLSRDAAAALCVAFAGLGLVAGLAIGRFTALWIGLFLLFATAYSVPPVRVRKTPFATLLIGAGALTAFLAGYSTLRFEARLALDPLSLRAAIVIFIMFSLITVAKDNDDLEGDRADGVRNLYTILGRERAVRLTTTLLAGSFASPLIILHTGLDVAAAAAASVGGAALFYRRRRYQDVLLIGALVAVYWTLRCWQG